MDYIMENCDANIIPKKIIFDANYMDWLCDFCLIHNCFTDDEWEYSIQKLSDIDIENIKYLKFLFLEIEKFAKDNSYSLIPCYSGGFYRLVYNDNAFEIGFQFVQEESFFCKKVPYDNNIDFINFSDLINKKKEDGNIKIYKK